MVRTLPGSTAAQPGGYRVSSFFDIFTDISLDSGVTWHSSRNASHVELVASPPAVGEATDTFPPQGSYNGPAQEITRFTDIIWVRRCFHPIPPITFPWPLPCLSCPPEINIFDPGLTFEVTLDGGQHWAQLQTTSQVGVWSDQVMAVGNQRVFRHEMVQLDAFFQVPGSPDTVQIQP